MLSSKLCFELFERHSLTAWDGRYFNINPLRFQKGDIVEITISFFCVQTRSDTLKMLTSLKGLTLIDDKFREVQFLYFKQIPQY